MLLVKKTGPNVEIKKHEFTANRLSGLVAAYAFCNRLAFDNINSSEAECLGLKWDKENPTACRIYLSAVSGTEHFYEQFSYWPLICAVRKLQLKKITIEPVLKMAKIKNPQGVCMAKEFVKNVEEMRQIWREYFTESPVNELLPFIMSTSPLWKIFKIYF